MRDGFELLVVGGGPAGFSAARAYRDAGGEGRVGIVTDEHRMPYERPPLTKQLLRGESTEAELPLEDESWLEDRDVALVSGHAVQLRRHPRVVVLTGGRELTYGQCVLTTGAEPMRLPVPGADRPAVRVVRSLDHLRELQRRLSDGAVVAVIGSGFIGCEIASSLRTRGHRVALISDEPAPNAGRLGEEAAGTLRRWLSEDGVDLHLGAPVERIDRLGAMLAVCAGHDQIVADLVVMATGVAPRTELATLAEIALSDRAIPVSAAMRTAADGVLAAGDVCKAENLTAGRSLHVEHWGDALSQGQIAGATVAGEDAAWSDVPGFWSTIGSRTLKYAAWGDGYRESRFERHPGGGFTVWYGRDGTLVGVLTHEADDDYERGIKQTAQRAPWS